MTKFATVSDWLSLSLDKWIWGAHDWTGELDKARGCRVTQTRLSATSSGLCTGMEEVTGCTLEAAASRLKETTPSSINQCIPLLGSCSEKHNLYPHHSTRTLDLPFTAHDGGTKEQKGFCFPDSGYGAATFQYGKPGNRLSIKFSPTM